MVRVKIKAGLTLASEDSYPLAKFQPTHKLLHLRCHCRGGCREQEMKGVQDTLADRRIHNITFDTTMYITSVLMAFQMSLAFNHNYGGWRVMDYA